MLIPQWVLLPLPFLTLPHRHRLQPIPLVHLSTLLMESIRHRCFQQVLSLSLRVSEVQLTRPLALCRLLHLLFIPPHNFYSFMTKLQVSQSTPLQLPTMKLLTIIQGVNLKLNQNTRTRWPCEIYQQAIGSSIQDVAVAVKYHLLVYRVVSSRWKRLITVLMKSYRLPCKN